MARRKAFGLKITLSAGLILVSSVMVLAVISAGGSSSGNFNNTAKVATTAASDQQTLAQPASVIPRPQCPTGYTLSNGQCSKTDTHTPFCTDGFDLIITLPPPVHTTKCRKIYDAVRTGHPVSGPLTCPSGGSLVGTKCFLFETPRCHISYTLSDSENTCSRTFTSTPTCDGGFILSGSTCRRPTNATECSQLTGYHWISSNGLSSAPDGSYSCEDSRDATTICYLANGRLLKRQDQISYCSVCPAGQVVNSTVSSCSDATYEIECDKLSGYVWRADPPPGASGSCITIVACNLLTNYSASNGNCVYTAPTSCPEGQIRVNGTCRRPTNATECSQLTGYHWISSNGLSSAPDGSYSCEDSRDATTICYLANGRLLKRQDQISYCSVCPAGQVVNSTVSSCSDATYEIECDKLSGYVWRADPPPGASGSCITIVACNLLTNYSASNGNCVYTAPTSCPEGQIRVNGTCRRPTNATECSQLTGYHWISSNGLSSAPDGSYSCEDSRDATTICYLANGRLLKRQDQISYCSVCPAGQVVNSTVSSCSDATYEIECDKLSGYVWRADPPPGASGSCITIAACNRLTNYSASGDDCVYTAPTSCPEGQIRVNGTCRRPTNATECSQLTGYHWISSNGSYSCEDSRDATTICYLANGRLLKRQDQISYCSVCPAGQVVNSTVSSCSDATYEIECDKLSGYVWVGSNAGLVLPQCITIDACNRLTNYSASGDDCVYTAPTSCPEGQIRVNGTCRRPTNATECSQLTGYHWISSNGSYSCEDSRDATTICYLANGRLLKRQDQISYCSVCPAGQVVNSTVSSCSDATYEIECDKLSSYVWRVDPPPGASGSCITIVACNLLTNYSASNGNCVYSTVTPPCPEGQTRNIDGDCTDTTTGEPVTTPPGFNILTDFKSGSKYGSLPAWSHDGDEREFVRWGTGGIDGQTINACTDGQEVDLWTYIHNGRGASHNGDNFEGSVVAHNANLKLAIPQHILASSHTVRSTINSDDTAPLSGVATIECDQHPIELVYENKLSFTRGVPTTTQAIRDRQFNNLDYQVSGDPTSSEGASLGFGGVVPACRDYIIEVTTKVRIVVPTNEVGMSGSAGSSCDGIDGQIQIDGVDDFVDDVKVRFNLSADGSSWDSEVTATSLGNGDFKFAEGYISDWQTTQNVQVKISVSDFNSDGTHTGQFIDLEDLNGNSITVTLDAWDANDNGQHDCDEDDTPPSLTITGNASGSCTQMVGWTRIKGISELDSYTTPQVKYTATLQGSNPNSSHDDYEDSIVRDTIHDSGDRFEFSRLYPSAWRSYYSVDVVVEISEIDDDGTHSGDYDEIADFTLPAWKVWCDDYTPGPQPQRLPMRGQASYSCAVGISGSVTIDGIAAISSPRPLVITYSTDPNSTADDIFDSKSLTNISSDTIRFSKNYQASWKTDRPINVSISATQYYDNGQYTYRSVEIATVTLAAWDADNDGRQDCRDLVDIDGRATGSCQGIRGWVRISGLDNISNHQPVQVSLSSDPNSTSDDLAASLTKTARDTYSFSHGYHQAWKSAQPITIGVSVLEYNSDGSYSGSSHDLNSVSLPAWDA